MGEVRRRVYYCAKLGFIQAIGMSASKEAVVGVVPEAPDVGVVPKVPGAGVVPKAPVVCVVPEAPGAGETPMWARSADPSL